MRKTEIETQDITRYIDYLTGKYGYYITLHGEIVSVPAFSRYNFHLNPYCRYIKTVCENWDICVKRQQSVFEKCAFGPFFGICHAGVGEYVYPVTVEGKNVGFLSVSGYRGKEEQTATGKTLHFAEKNGIDGASLLAMREKFLRLPEAESELPDTLIRPLVFLLESYFERQSALCRQAPVDDLFTKVLRFVTVNHNRPVTMELLSRQFHYSVSTLSHLFRKNTGLALNEYIENLRLDEAGWLLRQSALSVSEIATCVGFCTPAYFSTVFKKKYGLSPKEYRHFSSAEKGNR